MKILLLLIAVGLIGVVLYLGYQMDKKEEQKKRREKYSNEKNLYNTDIEARVSNLYNPKKTKRVEKPLDNFKKRVKERTDDIKEYLDEKKKEHVTKNVKKIEEKSKFNLKTQDMDEDEFIENGDEPWEVIDEDFLIERKEEKIYDDIKKTIEEPIIPDTNEENEQYTTEIEENIIIEETNHDKTMVVPLIREEESRKEEKEDTEIIDEIIETEKQEDVLSGNIKGYDFENDENELLDIEQTIAAANIKKFKRNKNAVVTKKTKKKTEKDYLIIENDVEKKPKEKNTTEKKQKKFTKKKENSVATNGKKEENKNIKKYTRKKVKVKEKEEIEKKKTAKKYVSKKAESKKEEPKKRGRKPKNKQA